MFGYTTLLARFSSECLGQQVCDNTTQSATKPPHHLPRYAGGHQDCKELKSPDIPFHETKHWLRQYSGSSKQR